MSEEIDTAVTAWIPPKAPVITPLAFKKSGPLRAVAAPHSPRPACRRFAKDCRQIGDENRRRPRRVSIDVEGCAASNALPALCIGSTVSIGRSLSGISAYETDWLS